MNYDLPALILSAMARAKTDRDHPMTRPDIMRRVRGGRPSITPDRVDDAMEALHGSAQICHCRITVGNGHGQDYYWPTGVRPRLTSRDIIIGSHTRADAARAGNRPAAKRRP